MEFKKKKKKKQQQQQQQQHYIWKYIITFYAPKKKNTNVIHNLIHTHIYIITLDIYYERIIT